MLRRLPLAVLLLLLGGATALAKPKVAVLGLEVKGTSALDKTATTVAHELTEGLRIRARRPKGPYSLAPNSDKELIDQKLIKSCDDEAIACMTSIGKDLEADYLIYGKLEHESDQYTVTLHVLDVHRRASDNTIAVPVPLDTPNDKLRKMAKQAYTDLTRTAAEEAEPAGTLIVHSNVERAKVYLDGEYQGRVTAGTLRLEGVGAGSYRLAVTAANHDRKELPVAVTKDDTTEETVALTAQLSAGTKALKPAFYTTAVIALALGGVSFYAWRHFDGPLSEKVQMAQFVPQTAPFEPSDCDHPEMKISNYGDPQVHANVDDLCRWQKIHVYTGIATVGVGVTALVLYLMTLRGHDEAESGVASRHASTHRFAFAPVITPSTTGASFELIW